MPVLREGNNNIRHVAIHVTEQPITDSVVKCLAFTVKHNMLQLADLRLGQSVEVAYISASPERKWSFIATLKLIFGDRTRNGDWHKAEISTTGYIYSNVP